MINGYPATEEKGICCGVLQFIGCDIFAFSINHIWIKMLMFAVILKVKTSNL